MTCRLGLRRARAKRSGACFRTFVLSNCNSKLKFWQLLPVPVIGIQQFRVPRLSAEEWTDKKVLSDTKSEMVQAHGVQLNEEEKSAMENILKQVLEGPTSRINLVWPI